MTGPMTETPDQIREVAEAEAVGTELTKGQISDIVEVSVSSDEARNRVRAIVEGRVAEDDVEHLTHGEESTETQAHEVERAQQGDAEMQAARLAEAHGEDPGKALKQAKKDSDVAS